MYGLVRIKVVPGMDEEHAAGLLTRENPHDEGGFLRRPSSLFGMFSLFFCSFLFVSFLFASLPPCIYHQSVHETKASLGSLLSILGCYNILWSIMDVTAK